MAAGIVCVLLALPSSVSAQRWVAFGNASDRTQYYDADSIRADGPLLKVWVRIDFREPKFMPKSLPHQDEAFSRTLMIFTINCQDGTTGRGGYAVIGANGDILFNYPEYKQDLAIPPPGSADDWLARALCAHGESQSATPGTNESPSAKVFGSGFVVGPGLVITNAHVVHGCKLVNVLDSSKTSHSAAVIASDTQSDLALLKSNTNYPATATFRTGRGIRVGEPVFAFGFPLPGLLSTDVILSSGIVNALAGFGNDSTRLQISAPVQQGNSGGPLLDSSSLVVGVVVAKLDAVKVANTSGDIPQNVNFAIKSEVVRMFLEANGFKPGAGVPGVPGSSEEVAARGRAFTVQVECTK
jgi:S1-C subfamily serine protease